MIAIAPGPALPPTMHWLSSFSLLITSVLYHSHLQSHLTHDLQRHRQHTETRGWQVGKAGGVGGAAEKDDNNDYESDDSNVGADLNRKVMMLMWEETCTSW